MSKAASTALLLLSALVFVGGVGALVIARRRAPAPPPVLIVRDPAETARGLSERMQEAMTAKGDLTQLLPDAVKLAEKNPRCFEAQLLLGQLYIAQKRYDLAYPPTLAALDLRPLGQELTKLLGTLAANTDQPEQAKALYRHALDKTTGKHDRGLLHAMLGAVAQTQGNLTEADAQYAQAVADDAFLISAHAARADMALAQNKLDQALEYVETGEQWGDPKADKSPFVILKARILLAKKQPDEAYRLLLTGLSSRQRLTLPAAAVLAQIWDGQGKPAKAASYYEEVATALETPPDPQAAKPGVQDTATMQAQAREARQLAAKWREKAGK